MSLEHRAPNPFETLSLRVFGGLAADRIKNHPDLSTKLAKAREYLVPTAFLAAVYMRVALVAALGIFVFVFYGVVAGAAGTLDMRLLLAAAFMPVVLPAAMWGWEMLRPELAMRRRRRSVEANLPYALNFMAAMAAAGVVPEEIFGAIGKQKVYGEVRLEAAQIYRDTRLFGKDLIQAMHDGSRRSPSPMFEEFLQGAINTITSGGNFKIYLLARAEQVTEENRRRMTSFLEGLGVMAESYVVVAAAAPLFLIVIISVLAVLSGGDSAALFLNLIVLVMLPIIHASFTYILRSMRVD